MTNYVPCPKCGAAAEKLKFTWWGGVLGPRILTHVRCTGCGYKYNGKSGKDNNNGIIIYSVIVGLLVLGLVVVMFAALALLMAATR
jgi:rubredoxin